jgi:hypothetical protein
MSQTPVRSALNPYSTSTSIKLHIDFDALAIPSGNFLRRRWMSFTINPLANAKEHERKLAAAPTANRRRGFDALGDLLTTALSVLSHICRVHASTLAREFFKPSGRMSFPPRQRLDESVKPMTTAFFLP